MATLDKNDYRVCPLDPAHVIKASKFITHVHKCAKSKQLQIFECPFNKLHLFTKKLEVDAHIKHCPCNLAHSVFSTSKGISILPTFLVNKPDQSEQ
ncbi:hypothetical protein GJ496_010805, partial [Pomphorhynchus laevis]